MFGQEAVAISVCGFPPRLPERCRGAGWRGLPPSTMSGSWLEPGVRSSCPAPGNGKHVRVRGTGGRFEERAAPEASLLSHPSRLQCKRFPLGVREPAPHSILASQKTSRDITWRARRASIPRSPPRQGGGTAGLLYRRTCTVQLSWPPAPHLHSLHFDALVATSAAISAWFSTGPGQVAQLAEHAAENRGVGSSILPLATVSSRSRARAPLPIG